MENQWEDMRLLITEINDLEENNLMERETFGREKESLNRLVEKDTRGRGANTGIQLHSGVTYRSADKERVMITVYTGLSLLLPKVNLKRKHEDEKEYDSEELVEGRQKRFKKMTEAGRGIMLRIMLQEKNP